MGLRDLLSKKHDISQRGHSDPETVGRLAAPEFTFIRSDTYTQEVISPPSMPQDYMTDGNNHNSEYLSAASPGGSVKQGRGLDIFRNGRRNHSASEVSSVGSASGSSADKRRLSQWLHLSRRPSTSEHVPENLPEIKVPEEADELDAQLQWEKRATILAQKNKDHGSRPTTPTRKASGGVVSNKKTDEYIQEAIKLHEEGQLEESTRLFGVLSDPNGANNPLSQVLYGLALRHGWGCDPNPTLGITYLTKAASNAAVIENMALLAGQKKGGAAKGELVLAIFELANCFRYGWGIPKDPITGKHYYETAANLGDTDAMNEVAWCYLEGFGCRKDKFASAKYYRMAENNGNKTLGNSCILF